MWDRAGTTPLHAAVAHGNPRTVKTLLQAGAKPTARDAAGLRPLHAAVLAENRRVVKLLLTHPVVDVDAVDHLGSTALHLAASFWTAHMCARLLDAGADPNSADCNGTTPLHWACYTGFGDTVRMLLARGARADAKDHQGRLPWHWAGDGANAETWAIMEKIGVGDGEAVVDNDGNRPVMAKRGPHGLGCGCVCR